MPLGKLGNTLIPEGSHGDFLLYCGAVRCLVGILGVTRGGDTCSENLFKNANYGLELNCTHCLKAIHREKKSY